MWKTGRCHHIEVFPVSSLESPVIANNSRKKKHFWYFGMENTTLLFWWECTQFIMASLGETSLPNNVTWFSHHLTLFQIFFPGSSRGKNSSVMYFTQHLLIWNLKKNNKANVRTVVLITQKLVFRKVNIFLPKEWKCHIAKSRTQASWPLILEKQLEALSSGFPLFQPYCVLWFPLRPGWGYYACFQQRTACVCILGLWKPHRLGVCVEIFVFFVAHFL